MIEELRGTSTLYGSNAPFIEQQYEIYLANPGAVSADWRAYFDELRDGAQDVAYSPVIDSFIQLAKNRRLAAPMVDAQAMHKQVLVLRLISKYRTLGVFHADLDPLKRQEKPYIADLDIGTYGFTEADMEAEFDIGSFNGVPGGASRLRLRDLNAAVHRTCCRPLCPAHIYMSHTPHKR